MSDGRQEAAAAARWWADRLADPEGEMRTGDGMTEAVALFARSKVSRPTAEQVEMFRAHLEEALLGGPVRSEAWAKAVTEGDPRWGSALRAFGVDYGPDRILGDALEAAGLNGRSSLLLPLKTMMWFNPGMVTAGLGYNAPAAVVWEADGADEERP